MPIGDYLDCINWGGKVCPLWETILSDWDSGLYRTVWNYGLYGAIDCTELWSYRLYEPIDYMELYRLYGTEHQHSSLFDVRQQMPCDQLLQVPVVFDFPTIMDCTLDLKPEKTLSLLSWFCQSILPQQQEKQLKQHRCYIDQLRLRQEVRPWRQALGGYIQIF